MNSQAPRKGDQIEIGLSKRDLPVILVIVVGLLFVFGPLVLAYRDPARMQFVYESSETVLNASELLFSGQELPGVSIDLDVFRAIEKHGSPRKERRVYNRVPLIAPGENLTIYQVYTGQRTFEQYTLEYIFEEEGLQYRLRKIRVRM